MWPFTQQRGSAASLAGCRSLSTPCLERLTSWWQTSTDTLQSKSATTLQSQQSIVRATCTRHLHLAQQLWGSMAGTYRFSLKTRSTCVWSCQMARKSSTLSKFPTPQRTTWLLAKCMWIFKANSQSRMPTLETTASASARRSSGLGRMLTSLWARSRMLRRKLSTKLMATTQNPSI